ncbi:MAG: AAA family ATPase [Lachnospiraceae bacterium]|nr:AAA family ATPase [Lachnospiraceae bacterium]
MNNIILEGFMGSGKSTVGKILSKKLALPLVDIDKKVSGRLGMKPVEVYDRFGDSYYRAMETMILSELVEDVRPVIIVLGSGLALMEQNDSYLNALGRVYYIKTPLPTLLNRISKNEKHAWLQDDDLSDHVSRMLKEREPAYLRIANEVIDTDGLTCEEIAERVLSSQKQHA